MQAGNLLIKLFWKQVHVVLVGLGFLPVLQNVKLGKHLVGEGARHDERRMACRTAQVQQTSRSKHDHSMPIREDESIHLWFDVFPLDALKLFQASHVNLVIKVTNVANDGIVLHLLHISHRQLRHHHRGAHEKDEEQCHRWQHWSL